MSEKLKTLKAEAEFTLPENPYDPKIYTFRKYSDGSVRQETNLKLSCEFVQKGDDYLVIPSNRVVGIKDEIISEKDLENRHVKIDWEHGKLVYSKSV